MHLSQKIFMETQKIKYPNHFKGDIIDFGSLDVNGNNRYLADNSYVGVDVQVGDNVDIICKCHEFKAQKKYDVVMSTEMLEHDPFWELSIKNMVKILKKGGLLLITTAGELREPHDPYEHKHVNKPYQEHYHNFTSNELSKIVGENWANLDIINTGSDIYIVGVK